jgi:lysozyme
MNRRVMAVALAVMIAKPAEGLYHYGYYDPPGILTVCWGSTSNVIKDRYYSLDECQTRIDNDMGAAVAQVDRCQPGLPVKVLAAFSDAVFNMGPSIACNTQQSTAARYLQAKDYTAACNQLPRWNKAKIAGQYVTLPGLTKRREAERKICLDYQPLTGQPSYLPH